MVEFKVVTYQTLNKVVKKRWMDTSLIKLLDYVI